MNEVTTLSDASEVTAATLLAAEQSTSSTDAPSAPEGSAKVSGPKKPKKKPALFGFIYHLRAKGKTVVATEPIVGSSHDVIYEVGMPIRFQIKEIDGKKALVQRHKREFDASGKELKRVPFTVNLSDLLPTR